MSMVEPTPETVPADLVALEVEYRAETARVNERRKSEPGACGYRAYLLGKQVANHPWLTAYPAGALNLPPPGGARFRHSQRSRRPL